MEPVQLLIASLFGVGLFALATRWHQAFGILGVSSLLSAVYYGFVWHLERSAYRQFHEMYGDLGIYSADYRPRGWHSIVLEFQPHVLSVLWGMGILLFLWKIVSSLGKR